MLSDQTRFEVHFYLTGWRRKDPYEIKLDREKMMIKRSTKKAVCSLIGGRAPKWSGYNQCIGNPLENILETDAIFPPIGFIQGLESSWMAWRDGTLDDQKVRQEILRLCEWVNRVSRSKPKTEIFRKIF